MGDIITGTELLVFAELNESLDKLLKEHFPQQILENREMNMRLLEKLREKLQIRKYLEESRIYPQEEIDPDEPESIQYTVGESHVKQVGEKLNVLIPIIEEVLKGPTNIKLQVLEQVSNYADQVKQEHLKM